jgi:hypothetical protein
MLENNNNNNTNNNNNNITMHQQELGSSNAANQLLQQQLQLESLKSLMPAKVKELMASMAWYSNGSGLPEQHFEPSSNKESVAATDRGTL